MTEIAWGLEGAGTQRDTAGSTCSHGCEGIGYKSASLESLWHCSKAAEEDFNLQIKQL